MPRLLAPSKLPPVRAPRAERLARSARVARLSRLFFASAAFFSQLIAFASNRAVVVFPVPRGPENRYACETLCVVSALIRRPRDHRLARDIGLKRCGRHLR